ncbi:MAG: glycosyltransferase family 87 protein [Phormidesmis sp.]
MLTSHLRNSIGNGKRLSENSLQKLWLISGLCLAILAAAYCGKGYYHLLLDPAGARDFVSRWTAQQYFYLNDYPFPSIKLDSPNYRPSLGEASYGAYFPWSFFSASIFIPPLPLGVAKLYYAVINLFFIFILSRFTYRTFLRYGRAHRFFAVASVLAISAHCTTLGLGQYGIILNGLLVLFFQCLQRGQLIPAGLLGGVALLKPNVTALYILVPLVQKKYKATAIAIAYTLVAVLLVAIASHKNPLLLIYAPFKATHRFAAEGNFLVNAFAQAGLSVRHAVYLMMVGGIASSVLLLKRVGQITLIQQFAIASVVGRLWTYHGTYDNTMLVFLYIALLQMTFIRPSPPNIFMLYLLGISLWIPAGWVLSSLLQVAQYVIWAGSLAFLLFRASQPLRAASPP